MTFMMKIKILKLGSDRNIDILRYLSKFIPYLKKTNIETHAIS